MTGTDNSAETTLHALLRVSAELESQSAKSAFRFAATKAYEAIVSQSGQVLREEQFPRTSDLPRVYHTPISAYYADG